VGGRGSREKGRGECAWGTPGRGETVRGELKNDGGIRKGGQLPHAQLLDPSQSVPGEGDPRKSVFVVKSRRPTKGKRKGRGFLLLRS